MSNYPDDIRQHDNDPRSPYYTNGPECDECGQELEVEDGYGEYGLECREQPCINRSCDLNTKTTNELAEHFDVTTHTLRQSNWINGSYRGWSVVGKSGFRNCNVWGEM